MNIIKTPNEWEKIKIKLIEETKKIEDNCTSEEEKLNIRIQLNKKINEGAGPYIAAKLFERLEEMVHGNHQAGQEILDKGFEHSPCDFKINVNWSFNFEKTNRRLVGGETYIKNAHYGMDRKKFDIESERRCNDAKADKQIREKFQNRVMDAQSSALFWSGETQIAHDFGEHSVQEYCSNCNGGGEIVCDRCGGSGRITCGSCNGLGTIPRNRLVSTGNHSGSISYNETYYVICGGCNNTGSVACSPRVQCRKCSGRGLFTELVNVKSIAKSVLTCSLTTEFFKESLFEVDLPFPIDVLANNINFELSSINCSNKNSLAIIYHSSTTVVHVDFSLGSKSFGCLALGFNAFPMFYRPPVFDHLLQEDLLDLAALIDSKNEIQINQKKAFSLFGKFRAKPVLDAALKKLASQTKDKPLKVEDVVFNSCEGFITPDSAKTIENGLIKILEKVSPSYSTWAWFLVMAIPFLYIFILAESNFEKSDGGFLTIILWFIFNIISAMAIAYIFSPIGYLASAISSAVKRSSIPKIYRGNGDDWKPVRGLGKEEGAPIIIIAVVISIFGTIYGVLSTYSLMPKINSQPIKMAMDFFRTMWNIFF